MKKRILISLAVVLAIVALIVFNKVFSKKEESNTFAEVKQGLFEITVNNAGELIAEKSLDIMGPDYNQNDQEKQQEQQQQLQQQQRQQQQQSQQQQSQQGQQRTSGQQSGGGQGGGGSQVRISTGGNMGFGGGQQRGGDFHMMDFKIQDIVPEGTIVKAGDYVAQLDRSNYVNTLQDAENSLKTLQSNLEMRVLDTAVTLTSLRDDIKNQRYAVEEAQIALDQSKYEPPATIRKAETNLNKQQRTLEQMIKAYSLRVIKNQSDITNQKYTVQNQVELVNNLQKFLSQFTVRAPADGMIIYKKDRLGIKRKTGSSINAFDAVIATLPDLTSMISKVYVSEIEVTKVHPGLKATITIDAFPSKSWTGTVITVGNIGETLPNSDAKMFEVQIKIDGTDMNLRPAMTTWNKIMLKSFDNVVYIPLDCVQAGPDSVPFVYKKNKTRQIVVLGEQNDKYVIVREGLEPGQNIYNMVPPEAEKFRLTGKELIAAAKENKSK